MLLYDEDLEIDWHHRLANLFIKSPENNFRTADTILHHLVKAHMRDEIRTFFRNDPRSLRIGHARKSLILKVPKLHL